jgi:hypothetical protein
LTRDVGDLLPLALAGEMTELDLVALEVAQLRLELVIGTQQFRRIADVLAPLMEIVCPVIEGLHPAFFN